MFNLTGFILPGHGYRTLANFSAQRYLGDIVHCHCNAITGFNGHLTDLLEPLLAITQPAHTANNQLLLPAAHIPAPNIGVVVLQGFHDIVL